VQREQAVGQRGVVLQHARRRADHAVARGAAEASVDDVEVQQQVGGPRGGGDPLRPVERGPALRERDDRQPVPGRDHLVVARGLRALGARGQQRGLHAGPAHGIGRVDGELQRGGAVLERAAVGDREQLRGPGAVLGAQHVAELGGGPGVGLALDAVGVGVERGREAALGRGEVAEEERGRLVGHAQGERRTGDPVQVRVGPQQQRVVVEHLLEVRHHPMRVDAVAGETTRELVVHAAAGHAVAGQLDHLQRGGRARALVVAEQELEHHRRRELRCAAEPAVLIVEPAAQLVERGVETGGVDGGGG